MKWLEKYGLLLLLIVAAIALGIVLYIKKNKQDISFDFSLDGDLGSILSGMNARQQQQPQQQQRSNIAIADNSNAKGIGLYADVPLTSIITNNGTIAKTLTNIVGSIMYNGDNIMQTNANSPALASVLVPAKGAAPVSDSVQILINPSSIKFISELIKGNKPVVKYNFNTNIAGQAYSFSNSSTVKPASAASGSRQAPPPKYGFSKQYILSQLTDVNEIKQVQAKLKLPVTGNLDSTTIDQIIATSYNRHCCSGCSFNACLNSSCDCVKTI